MVRTIALRRPTPRDARPLRRRSRRQHRPVGGPPGEGRARRPSRSLVTASTRERVRCRMTSAWLRLSEGSCPGDAGKAAALVLAGPEFVGSGGGRHDVGAAAVLHRRGGPAAVAVRVGMAGGVRKERRWRVRRARSRRLPVARSSYEISETRAAARPRLRERAAGRGEDSRDVPDGVQFDSLSWRSSRTASASLMSRPAR